MSAPAPMYQAFSGVRVVKRGSGVRVFLPDGSELRNLVSADVDLGCSVPPGKPATLRLVLSDFVVDAARPSPSDAEVQP